MEARSVSGLALAEAVGITPASISRILNGAARPRQGTLSKLMAALCRSGDDEQLLLRAYSGLPDAVVEEPAFDYDSGLTHAELDRVARYLELKALSIDFRESVARSLREAAIPFESYARQRGVVTDFLISGTATIALECKFNVNRDWEREVGTAQLLRRQLPCDHVMVVVPYINDLARNAANALAAKNATVVTSQEFVRRVQDLLTGGRI